mgnify:CR=1 FL=1|eukprot:3532148-Rhodomonas_salina.1
MQCDVRYRASLSEGSYGGRGVGWREESEREVGQGEERKEQEACAVLRSRMLSTEYAYASVRMQSTEIAYAQY